ncbi:MULTISPECIES: HesB/YadR/YfhF family protein [Lactobacillaceae]|uniref:HesB/YadR/YfhF family protein n=1 Tax=Lactobacillaceae TaxID=33958 RepID=UPI000C1B6D6A|nr:MULTISPECIES: iron-sulfur cluster biosynthesis protein [Lactobacillaceae]
MKIELTKEAEKWFEDEVELEPGSGVHFYGKVYGKTMVHDGFSIAFKIEKPVNPVASTEVNGITYYITAADEWFFARYDLKVDYDSKTDGPVYIFESNED